MKNVPLAAEAGPALEMGGAPGSPPPGPGRQRLSGLRQLARTSRTGTLGVLLLILMVALAILAPILTPYSPLEQFEGSELRPPSGIHWFGTDEFGRDIFTRIAFGARTSLFIGVLSVAIGVAVGVPSGLLAGYKGGWIDSVIMRWWDLYLAFPGILLAIAILTVLGPGTLQLAFVIALGQMPVFARLTRSNVLTERELDYVAAARIVGAKDSRIMFREILPNCLPPIVVQLSLAMAGSVLLAAGLSFLGLGTQPPLPSWGGMLESARAFLRDAPWYGVFPGVAIAVLVLALTYVADAVIAVLDPKSRDR